MPSGYQYSRKQGRWVKKEDAEAFDYLTEDVRSEALVISFFRWYPDFFLDVFESPNAEFGLAIPERLNMRIFARYHESHITGPRGIGKTYTAIGSEVTDAIFWPGTVTRYCGPSLEQTAELSSVAFHQLEKNYPAVTGHFEIRSESKNRFEIATQFGSQLAINAIQGGNCSQIKVEESGQIVFPYFDHATFQTKTLPTKRMRRMVGKRADPLHLDYKIGYITNGSTQQNDDYTQYRAGCIKHMREGGAEAGTERRKAFACDYSWEMEVLTGIRDMAYVMELKSKLTPDDWQRQMCGMYTGTAENPIIRDSVLTESKAIQVMEDRHCGDPDVNYIIGYDVSYADGAHNAKCAMAVLKLQEQKSWRKKDRYLKSLVYVFDSPPPDLDIEQARAIKAWWRRFSMENGNGACYIAIDAWQYGKAVVEWLHQDLGDGNPPFCCVNHEFAQIEQPGALPVIYAIKATGRASGSHDPDGEMIRYAELEFEHGNVKLLTTSIYEGVEAYKRAHGIKDDDKNEAISRPYMETKSLCGQIANLTKKATGTGMGEKRISPRIQRDKWSALKYALRFAQLLEMRELEARNRKKSDWTDMLERFADADEPVGYVGTRGAGGLKRTGRVTPGRRIGQ